MTNITQHVHASVQVFTADAVLIQNAQGHAGLQKFQSRQVLGLSENEGRIRIKQN